MYYPRFQWVGCGIHGGETYFTYSILAVEVLAAIHALKLALELGHLSIILEGDSKVAIDAFWSKQQSLTKCGHLIEKAKWLVNQFEAVKFNYVLRKCNIAAHNIARHARHVSKCTVWEGCSSIPFHCNPSRFDYCLMKSKCFFSTKKCYKIDQAKLYAMYLGTSNNCVIPNRD